MSPRVGLDKQKIVKTATEIIDGDGMEDLTLANVARKLSVRPPSLFNHVKGLPGIKKELTLHGMKKFYELLSDAIAGKAKDQAIFALADAYLHFSRVHPGLYELTLQAPDPEDTEIVEEGNKIIALITEILKDYQLTDENIIHATRGFRSILHGFSSLDQKGGFGLPYEKDKSLKILVKGYIAGLKQLREDQEE